MMEPMTRAKKSVHMEWNPGSPLSALHVDERSPSVKMGSQIQNKDAGQKVTWKGMNVKVKVY